MNLEDDDWQHLPGLWDAVDALAPGALITRSEADDYVLGLLPPERLAAVENLLAGTPAYRDQLLALRRECLEYAAQDTVEERSPDASPLAAKLQGVNRRLREAADAVRELLAQAFRVVVPEAEFGFSSRPTDEITLADHRLTLQIKPDRDRSRIRVIVETTDPRLAGGRIALVRPGADAGIVITLTRPTPDQKRAGGEAALSIDEARAALLHGFEIGFLPASPTA